jgi:SWI/SNF-related matrix-associated actin-dependent regulator 1 of chromatin subfamily A
MKRNKKYEPTLTLSLNSSTTFTHNHAVKLKPELIRHWKQLEGVEDISPSAPTLPFGPFGLGDPTIQFPLKHYQEVLRSLSRFQPDVKICGIPLNTLQAIQHATAMASRAPPTAKLLEMVPSHILENLYDYQKDGVAFAVSRGGRAMLADEMGVGKSRQGLALLAVYRWEWPAIILCPSSIKTQWRMLIEDNLAPLTENAEFRQKYAQFLLKAKHHGGLVREIQTGADSLDALVNIISYDLAGGKARELEARNFQVCLLDESHYLKSRSAKRVKVLLPILGTGACLTVGALKPPARGRPL